MEATIDWPARWQTEACEVLSPLLGTEDRVRIVVGDPETSVDGTVLEGHVYLDGTTPMIVHDRSGAPGGHPWRLLAGPVLRIHGLVPRRRPELLFADERWTPPSQPSRSARSSTKR